MSDAPLIRRPPAHKTHSVTDSLGRVIAFKEMSLVEQLRFVEAAGNLATNVLWRYLGFAIAAIRSIDGHPVPPITDRASIDSVAELAGEEALNAINAFLHPEQVKAKAAGEQKPDESTAVIKN